MKNYALFMTMLLCVACAAKHQNETADMMTTPAEVAEPVSNVTTQKAAEISSVNPYAQKAKLIRTADYRFKVNSVRKTTDAIDALLQKYPAYISNSHLEMLTGLIENKMTIRVQAEYFDALLKEIDVHSIRTDRREVTATDVGKEYVDLESRLKTKREVEARYMDILRKNTGKIEEILSAEQQIGQIHEEIEATVARMNYLREQVNYSTIVLEFYEEVPIETVAVTQPMLTKFKTAFETGFDGMVSILLVLTYLWPLLIVSALAYFTFRIRKKKVVLQ